jgi:Bacterial lectin
MHERVRKGLTSAVAVAVGVLGLAQIRTDAQTRANPAPPAPAAHRAFASAAAAAGTVLYSEPFNVSVTAPSRYVHSGSACLTAGTASTPATSIPACGAAAQVDASGAGALQLTQPIGNQLGFLAGTTAFSTAAGLVITFTEYSFGGTSQGADGLVAFLSDAGKAVPAGPGKLGGSLGYANGTSTAGIANAYIGVGLDEYGNFSNPTEGRLGGPGRVPETVAVRGAATINWRYLTGAKTAGGTAASLPFTFDKAASTTRPAAAPTVQITLTAAGALSVAIDVHDGKGFVSYIPPTSIVGLSGQPAVPASVYFGFSSSTGGSTSRHQIGGLTIATAGAGGPTPPPTPPPTAPPSSQDNPTYHNNNLRTGWYQHETTLNATNVASSAFHLIATLTTGGKSYSQPLYLTAQKLADGSTHNLLIVTDSTDVVYAYDADSLSLLWRRDFKGTGIRQQLSTDTGCDDTWPNIGINGTPVVDRARNRMYVVVPTDENGTFHLRLHALSVGNGADAVAPVEVSASLTLASGGTASVDPKFNFDRAGLLETNNTIYVPLATHCDFDSGASHGWMLSYSPDTLAKTGSSIDTTNKDVGTIAGVRFLGSIWEGGFGVAADAGSNIFFATGNGPSDGGGSDFGMSVLKVPPSLNFAQRDYFTPSTWQGDSQNDNDLSSGGVMLLPDQTSGPFAHLAIAGGKTGMKYLLNRENLGGLHSTDQILFEANTGGGIWGGPAYFVDSSGAQKIVYGGSPTLNAYTLKTASGYGLTLTSQTGVGALEHRNSGVTPIVSSNGTQAGTAVVWAIKTPSGSINGTGTITLYAFNGANLGTTLFTASAGRWTGNGDTGGAMITPLVANGRVYLATDGVVTVFGTH